MADKRIQKRHRKRIPLRYGVEAPTRMGFTEDISSEGIFIKTGVVLPPNTDLKIELSASTQQLVVLEGTVSWAKKVPPNLLRLTKGGMGIRITRFVDGEESYRQLCASLGNR